MIDWIKNLFGSPASKGRLSPAEQALLVRLGEELRECEALYRAGAVLCRQVCPERIQGDASHFAALMLDLHRGLLLKVFTVIASCDRRWHPAEREMALVLLHHVWGLDVGDGNLAQALRNVTDHAETLKWENVLRPFIEMPPLAEHVPEITTCVMRIANLIAKADGQVLPDEAERLKLIQAEMHRVLHPRRRAKQPRAKVAKAGQEVAQVVHAQVVGELYGDADKPAAAAVVAKEPAHQKSRKELLLEALRELDGLIGLDLIKKDIRQLINFLRVQKARRRHDLADAQVSLHTIFCGNPGTGKTTVARILARIFGALGLLEKGHTVETDRSGLVAEYVGQTGPKVNKRVDEALDGVLFIDEAYSLAAERGEDPFGGEALQALLKRMEDDRARLVVVLAGYPRPMELMLRSNPGLSSRFQRTFNFPDYTADELVRIFERMCDKNHYVLTAAARDKLHAGFQWLVDQRDEHFGNGRLARNLFEQAIRRMADRIVKIAPLTREILSHLEPEDIYIEHTAGGSTLSRAKEG